MKPRPNVASMAPPGVNVAENEQLRRATGLIAELSARHPDDAGGTEVTSDGHVVVHVRTGSALIAEVRSNVTAVPLRFVDINYSYQELMRVMDELKHDIPRLKAMGFDVVEYGPDIRNNSVRLRLRTHNARVVEMLPGRYRAAVTVDPRLKPQLAVRLSR